VTNKHHYQVFGLHVVSDILLPELMKAIDPLAEPQVSIALDKVPTAIADPILKTEGYQAAKGKFLFLVPDVASYYVTNGNSIVVEPEEQAQDYSVRLFLLGTSFGALLMQRGILPLHGSAVLIKGRGVVFTGMSGAGKSSLLAAFRKRDYPFLTDDVVAVTMDTDGIAWIHPSYPQQKMWRDSTKAIGVETESLKPFYTYEDQEKFAVPAPQGFWRSPAPLSAVYELQVASCSKVELQSLTGTDKLSILLSHTYRPWLIDGLGLKAAHFQQCAAVARQVTVSLLSRPAEKFTLEEQVRCVEQDLARLEFDCV
jgi:hypothetical protein